MYNNRIAFALLSLLGRATARSEGGYGGMAEDSWKSFHIITGTRSTLNVSSPLCPKEEKPSKNTLGKGQPAFANIAAFSNRSDRCHVDDAKNRSALAEGTFLCLNVSEADPEKEKTPDYATAQCGTDAGRERQPRASSRVKVGYDQVREKNGYPQDNSRRQILTDGPLLCYSNNLAGSTTLIGGLRTHKGTSPRSRTQQIFFAQPQWPYYPDNNDGFPK